MHRLLIFVLKEKVFYSVATFFFIIISWLTGSEMKSDYPWVILTFFIWLAVITGAIGLTPNYPETKKRVVKNVSIYMAVSGILAWVISILGIGLLLELGFEIPILFKQLPNFCIIISALGCGSLYIYGRFAVPEKWFKEVLS